MSTKGSASIVAIAFLLSSCVPPLQGDGGGGAGPAEAPQAPGSGIAVDPVILGTSPADGSSNAFKDDNIIVGFDVPLDETSLNASSVTLYQTSMGPGAGISGVVSYDSFTRSVVFNPNSNLQETTGYTAQIANTVKSASGGTLASAHTWNFTTRDQTPPTILGSSPIAGATNVDPQAPITVFFNEPLNPNSLTVAENTSSSAPIRFYQTNSSTILLPGTVSYSPGSSEFTFVPGVSLLPLTGYTLRITGGIQDASGNAMGATNFIVNFTMKDYLYATLSAPFDNAAGVPIDTSITVGFNHPINTATVNAGTFTVSGGVSSSLPISFSSGNTYATLVPSANLAPFTSYTVTLDGSVADTGGLSLGSPVNFHFTTGGGVTAWGVASPLDTSLNATDSTSYQAIQASNGDTFAIWAKDNIIYSSRMPAGGNWSAPTQISTPADGPLAFSPSIAVDGNGNAMAAWIGGTVAGAGGTTLTNTRAFTLKYLAGTGWFAPTSRTPLSSVSFPVVGPTRIAMNAKGWALVVWRRFSPAATPGNQYNLRSKTFFPNPSFATGGFGGSELGVQGSSSNLPDAETFQVGIDGNLNAATGIAVWTQSSTTSGQHLFYSKSSGTAWTPSATGLDSDANNILPDSLSMKMDSAVLNGTAIMAWSQGAPGARSVYARRFNGTNAWSAVTPLENQANDAQCPYVALTESSPPDALVVWHQADGSASANNIYCNRYTASSNSWQASGTKITSYDPLEAARPTVVVTDVLGNAMAVWRERTSGASTWQVYASRYLAQTSSWGPSVNLCADTLNPADLSSDVAPLIVGRTNRNPVALWSQKTGGAFTLWGNVFR